MQLKEILNLWNNYNICVADECYSKSGEKWVVQNGVVIGRPCIKKDGAYICVRKNFYYINFTKPFENKSASIIAYEKQLDWVKSLDNIVNEMLDSCVSATGSSNPGAPIYYCRGINNVEYKVFLQYNMSLVLKLPSKSNKYKIYTSKDEFLSLLKV